MPLHVLDDSLTFPDPNDGLVDPNGLLAIGGDLSPSRILAAYKQGIFPWFSDGEPVLWWSPNPRAVLDPNNFHISRSFKKFLNRSDYQVSINTNFMAVIEGCANHHDKTWITNEMIDAYIKLHQLGFAHSIEVWQNSNLIGGLYGIAQGALFCGESMFSTKMNASKVGLYRFCQHFVRHGGRLVDCQVLNDHTASLGAYELPREIYLSNIKKLQFSETADNCYNKQYISYHW